MGNCTKRPVLTWWHGAFFLLGLLTATAFHFALSTKPSSQKPQSAWGELEYTRFQLVLPDDHASEANAHWSKTPVPTLLMKLRVTPKSDLDALMRYWGQGNRGPSMRSFLESLARVPEGETLNISHFLPAIARTRLYTFPDNRKDRLSPQQDSLWTGMNFFNEAPDDTFTNIDRVEAKLAADYTQVTAGFAFGDLVVLRGGDRQIKHMCVHIADKVVFTNRGTDAGPWVLMPMAELIKQFSSEKSLQAVVYRRKQA